LAAWEKLDLGEPSAQKLTIPNAHAVHFAGSIAQIQPLRDEKMIHHKLTMTIVKAVEYALTNAQQKP
jgi:hypothetical protein